MTRLPCVAFAAVLSSTLAAQASWARLYPAQSPSPRRSFALVDDPVRGVVLMFGGEALAGALADFWQWNGTTWSQLPAGPPRRLGATMTFDIVRQRAVLFGGLDPAPTPLRRDDTWEWDGTSWFLRTPGLRPLGRDFAAMAYDARRHVVVLFGGRNPGQVPQELDDLWEWDGQTWQRRIVGTKPAPRLSAAMCFDPATQRVLLFGGFDATLGITYGDTWTWDGTGWQQRQPTTPPYPRASAAMTLDVARERVVLHGGNNYDPFTWEWDGAEWRLLLLAGPPPTGDGGMAYDAVRRCVTYLWMASWFSPLETWIYRTQTPAGFAPFGTGCAGSVGTPALTAPAGLAWLGDTFRTQVDAVPPGSTGAVFVNGLQATPPIDLTPVGLPGCNRFVTIDDTCFMLAANGLAEWVVNVPNDPFFAGVQFHQQVLVLDPAAPNGACVSNAATITIGIR